MTNKKLLNRQKTRFLLYNLAAFLLIFLILGMVAINAVERYFYRDADKELTESRNLLTAYNNPGRKDVIVIPPMKNPRINFLLYNQDKELLGHDLPAFWESIELGEPSSSERVYNRSIEGFHYRVMEFSLKASQQTVYAQVLINIDGEIALRNNIVAIYLVCLAVISVLTVAASYIMSSLTMKPIIKSMDRQTQFVSDASHELRTPLTALQSRLEQLLSYPDEKIIAKSEEISDCLSEVMRLTKLSNNLLVLARSDADKTLPEITDFDVYELINRVAVPYIDMAKSDSKDFGVEGESVIIHADSTKILQLLIILFDNALKYTAKGDAIDVRVKRWKNKCEITVADTGMGISAEGIGRVFERFYRDDKSRSVTEGSGLGLAIAKQIADEHGGNIFAEHNKPKGTKVTLHLPVVQ